MSAVPVDRRVDEFDAFVTTRNLRSTTDTNPGRTRICGGRDPGDITEQVFDTEADTPGPASPLVGRHLESFADRAPDRLR
jgi:hypothetical protein